MQGDPGASLVGRDLVGRETELAELEGFLEEPGPGLARVVGPRGTGKTTLITRALRGHRAVHFQALPLTSKELLGDLEATIRASLGEVPAPRRPGLLPLTTPEARWEALLAGLVDRALEEPGLVLILDGAETVLGAGRRWASVLAEALARARERGAGLKVILVGRSNEGVLPGGEAPLPDLDVSLGSLPCRAAGWAQGARTPDEAFLFWAVFGDGPGNLPKEEWRQEPGAGVVPGSRPGSDGPGPPVSGGDEGDPLAVLEEPAVSRILDPAGDLFDAPLRLMDPAFRRPARYLAILRTLAQGPLEWSRILAGTSGVSTGGQLAPYLRKLEDEGLVISERPLDAEEGSRNRRYLLSDPFLAFWFGKVLPNRSLLTTLGPVRVWRDRIRPGLEEHMERWLARGARLWLRFHGREALPARARSVGGLWAGEADFDPVAWLENGQVCYGLTRWDHGPLAGDDLPRAMTARMKATRYGIGREARAPLYFLPWGGGEAVRREVAREPLARVLTLEDLMGPEPPG